MPANRLLKTFCFGYANECTRFRRPYHSYKNEIDFGCNKWKMKILFELMWQFGGLNYSPLGDLKETAFMCSIYMNQQLNVTETCAIKRITQHLPVLTQKSWTCWWSVLYSLPDRADMLGSSWRSSWGCRPGTTAGPPSCTCGCPWCVSCPPRSTGTKIVRSINN